MAFAGRLAGSLAGKLSGTDLVSDTVLGPIHYPTGTPPDEILGTDLNNWFRSDSGIVLDSGNVASWTDRASATVLTPTTATGPTYNAVDSNFAGWPSLSSNEDKALSGVLAAALAAASRPYFWTVARATATPSAIGGRAWAGVSDPATANSGIRHAFTLGGTPPTNFGTSALASALTGGGETITTAVWDTNPHLFEFGALATTTNKAFVDGVGYNGSVTGALANAKTDLFVLRTNTTGNLVRGAVVEIVVAKSLPTEAQQLAMRAYFKNRYNLTLA